METADGGRAALAAVARQPPAVIVLDVTMPDLDGVAVLRRLRASGIDVPVCVLSARDDVEDRVAGLQAGADDYLVKPFALEELFARLHALLRRREITAPGSPRRTERRRTFLGRAPTNVRRGSRARAAPAKSTAWMERTRYAHHTMAASGVVTAGRNPP